MFSLFKTLWSLIYASCVNIMSILSQTKINFSNFPVNLWVASYMVYAFPWDNAFSIWCICMMSQALWSIIAHYGTIISLSLSLRLANLPLIEFFSAVSLGFQKPKLTQLSMFCGRLPVDFLKQDFFLCSRKQAANSTFLPVRSVFEKMQKTMYTLFLFCFGLVHLFCFCLFVGFLFVCFFLFFCASLKSQFN